ncbi:dimethylaniline monooxygenase [N-oxide-forming] 2 isoform X1 [Pipistrellus kuhlii]|uniref:Flavin-containing monooxygenase n=1 Tax=Pipistrellus kuhlii TaxID=59472 RepID=A0A7J7UT10_PIPKU|nr:dimethylaniline monooxygenase [N-oxide-forming] 2 isoform X1 [Pipistrellus kuhlii]XP_036298431.1 dimethylaniline monooxygenase [N-oxide-forming] 2 isoform X1 [Pipistrellus kuhlii]XP_036298433.1 dimethylaniline monooxygenase [N-oxide-forming] 2 isoform X1 [Pipistrellus kuhlii]KAF6316029.1 flavin containing dimethylaniline monooxygenase 2 [Pipistrellus kuhlii]
MAKKVAVIGAGVSGLISLKCCVDEGLEPTCFERTEDIGGLWRFKENVEDGRASIYQSVITNTSKEMSCFSDFPMPEDFPNFLHNSKLLEYFRIFAKKFDLLKYIQFQTTVLSVKKCPDFSSSGQWEVVTESKGKEQSAIFDAIMVCSGHHILPRIPLESFPGIERFKGQHFHSRQYKNPEGFEGKRILVIGIGNSASDIAVELSKKASQVFLSTRQGSWVFSRISDNGYPWDMVLHTRFRAMLQNVLPRAVQKWMLEQQMNQWFNHENYGLEPQNKSLMKESVVNDDLPSRILYGAIKVKTRVTELTETSATFEDGTVEEDIDVIVFATGYTFSFPFLEDSLVKVEDNMVSLYKYMFPPHLEKATFACIGLIQPLGSIFPTVELQARWVTRVFKDLCTLPSESAMMEDIIKRHKNRIDLFGESQSQILQTKYIDYLDELAAEIGAKPDLLSLLFKDPKLAVKLYFGPCNSYQYRLVGPGRWEGAKNAILSQKQRLLKPLKTRTLEPASNFPVSLLLKILGLLAIALAFFF